MMLVSKDNEPSPGTVKLREGSFEALILIVSTLQLCCVIMSLVAIILFRITLLNWAFSGLSSDDGTETFLFSQARLLTSLGASSLNLLVIITLNKVTAASRRCNRM